MYMLSHLPRMALHNRNPITVLSFHGIVYLADVKKIEHVLEWRSEIYHFRYPKDAFLIPLLFI